MSYTMSDGTYFYTVTTWTKLTVSPSRINNYLSDIYTPTITRTTTGGAVTRYFTFIVVGGAHDVTLTQYKAVFLSNSKTALVSVQSNNYKLGRIANQYAINQALVNQINVQLRTSASGNVITTAGGASYSLAFSGFTPNTPTIDYSAAQTTPSAAQFGLIKGFASASWSASIAAKTWTFTDTSTQTINPPQTLSLSANGATASSGSGTGTRSASLAAKLVSATSLTGTATVTNVLGGSASNTKTLTVQDYIKPSLSALTVSRDSNNHAVITFNWSVAGVNEANTAANPCTSGTVTATWNAVDNGSSPTTWNGTKTIIADGAVMGGTTGSCTITETAHTYDPDKTYTIAITITDRLGQSSATITTILASEFYTIDFLAGGQGIAIGKAADKIGFEVNMDTFSPALAGTVQMFAGTTAPNGWLICNGAAVSRTKYARLFSVLGTTYGAGDGSTTFNLPDLRGRFPLGVGTGTATGHTAHALADAGGNENLVVPYHAHYLPALTTGNQSASHSHSSSTSGEYIVTTGDSEANNTRVAYSSSGNRWVDGQTSQSHFHHRANTGAQSASHTHTIADGKVTKYAPDGDASYVASHDNKAGANMPPYIGINFIIHAGVPTL